MDESTSGPLYERIIPRSASWASLGLVSILSLAIILSGVNSLTQNISQLIVQNEEMYATAMVASQQSKNQNNKPLTGESKETDRIIVKYKEKDLPPGLAVAAERANIEKAQGLKELLTISGIGAVVYQVGEDDTAAEVVGRLLTQKKDLIEYAEVDMLVAPNLVPNDPLYGSQWHHPKIQTPVAWDSALGEGVTVVVLDTGVNPHPDLALSSIPMRNFYDGSTNVTDVYGHGSLVAGGAAAIGSNGVGVSGISPKTQILNVKIARDTDGYGSWSAMAQGITYAADNGVRVANISYGACETATVASAANYMRSKGGVVIIAAGNTGALLSYANNNSLTCVSAVGSNDARTSWSSFGNYVDVTTPGAGIYTTNKSGGYSSVSGTSLSSPLTAGIYALMFSANPALTPTQADNILFSTADDLGTAGWDQYYGHGRVNAAKAVAAALATKGTQDTIAPTVPTKLVAGTITSNTTALSWVPATDDNSGVAGYTIYRNGTKLTTIAGTAYTSTNLTPETTYTYTVRAEDVAGNQSSDSASISVTTGAIEFGISAFSVPTKTTNSANVGVMLTKPGTVTIKYGTSAANLNLSASSATTTTSHSVPLTSLTAATTYYYQVTATDGTATLTSSVSSFKTNKVTGGGKPNR